MSDHDHDNDGDHVDYEHGYPSDCGRDLVTVMTIATVHQASYPACHVRHINRERPMRNKGLCFSLGGGGLWSANTLLM
jgi:hypothetical protein